jgi:hypothetical protein
MTSHFGSCSPKSNVLLRMFARLLPCAAFAVVAWLTVAAQVNAQSQARPTGGQGLVISSSPDVVQGTVVNRVTGEPVARALVYTPDNRFATLTDDRGHFELKFPARDNAQPPSPTPNDDPDTFQAKQRELQQWYQRNTHPDNFFARKPGFLQPDNSWTMSYSTSEHPGPILISLEPEGHIIGHVQLPDADGTENGQIQLYRQEFEEGRPSWRFVDTVKIRANGEFRFAELPSGTYKVFTLEQIERIPPIFNPRRQLFGYPPVFFPNTKDFSSATPIHLAAGATFEASISLARREYYPVKIAVSGAGAGGTSIAVYPQGHPGPGYELGFDPSEEAVRGLLPDGSYTLKVSAQQGQEGFSGVLNFTVRGGPVEGLSITLIPNISLAVNVKTDFQPEISADPQVVGGRSFRSISNGQIAISLTPVDLFENGRGAFANRVLANQENEWMIADISPGTYRVQIQAPGCYVVFATWGGADMLRHPLVVGTDGAGTPIEVVLRDDGAVVSGTVQESRHDTSPSANAPVAPASDATVYFLPVGDSDGQFRSVQTHGNEQFTLTQIPPGTYRLLAFPTAQKDLDLSNPVEMRKYESKGIVLQLAPNQNETLPTPLTLVDEP